MKTEDHTIAYFRLGLPLTSTPTFRNRSQRTQKNGTTGRWCRHASKEWPGLCDPLADIAVGAVTAAITRLFIIFLNLRKTIVFER